MRFSQRYGYKPVRDQIQKDSIDEPLRNGLWNVFLELYDKESPKSYSYNSPRQLILNIYVTFFQAASDTVPYADAHTKIRSWFYSADYANSYDFIEFLVQSYGKKYPLADAFNVSLKKYLADVRFVEGLLTPIMEQSEIDAIEAAIQDTQNDGVSQHLKQALHHLSDRSNPDYRNSIKESISAVECLCRTMTDTSTLGSALKSLNKDRTLPQSLTNGWEKLYGWTSGKGGIRHGLMDEETLDADMAKYFLVSCASFINLLRTR